MIDKIKAGVKATGKKAARASKKIVGIFKPPKGEPRKNLEIRVVHESVLKRELSLEDLRGNGEARTAVCQAEGTPHGGAHCRRSQDTANTLASLAWKSLTENHLDRGFAEEGQYHGIGHLPDNEMGRILRQAEGSFALRSGTRARLKGLMIDPAVPVAEDGLESAVDPTNVNVTRQPPRKPSLWPVGEGVDKDCDSTSLENSHWPFERPCTDGQISSVSSCIIWEDRFDSYIDAIRGDDARESSIHTVLETDIARLVAEMEVLNNRVATANLREAYHRKSTLGSDIRPQSWPTGRGSIRELCTCHRGKKPGSEVQGASKRRTWHGERIQPVQSQSKESETREQIIERHSAGTNLFRHSLYGHLDESHGQLEGKHEEASPLRVEFEKSFNLRGKCERVFRRIRPTFAILRT